MRQIKFRGETLGGRIVYGFFCCTEVEDVTLPCIIVEEGDYRQVKPESVAQLVEIDSNGKEVYEGDEVVDKFGEKYLAQLTPTLRENHEGAGGVFSKPTERFWAERRQYMPLTLVEQCT